MRTKYSFEGDADLAQWANEIEYAGSEWGVDPALIAAIIRKESSGVADVWSSDHAHWGLGQISQDIADTYAGGKGYGEGSDPNDNIWAIAGYLHDLIVQYGDEQEAISAYNLGHADLSANPDYVADVNRYRSSITSAQVAVSGNGAAAQPVAYDIPVGDVAAYIATTQFSDGEQWRGQLGSDAAGWCDDWAREVYKRMFDSLGKEDIFGDGVVNDQAFRSRGAYHEGSVEDIGAQLQPGDLVDTPGHVGIYIGHGMVRSRQSSMGVHDLRLQDFSDTFGGIQGYGSLAEATGGLTAKSTLIGMTQVNRAAEEAAKRLQQAREEAKKLSAEMAGAIFENDAYGYQKDWAKFTDDIKKKKQEINKIAATSGMDKQTIAALNKTLDEYTDSAYQKFIKKWREAWNEFELASKAAIAQSHHDYEESANIEYEQTIAKLDQERKKKEKELMRDKDDYKTRKQISDWYYAQVDEALDKQHKAKQEAHDRYVEYLVEEGNLAQLVAYMGTPTINASGVTEKSAGMKKGEESLNLEGERKLAKEYVKVWQAAHGSMSSYIADVSDNLYSTMADSMTEFIKGTKSAKSALQDFGNSVLNMMAKIAAQRLAASWMTSLLGIFSGSRGGTSAAWSWGGSTHASNFGVGSVTSSLVSAHTSSLPSLINVPKFAKGGIVTAPTLAMIGEGGDNEAVIPLNDHTLKSMGGGSNAKGGGVVVNITNKTDSQVSVQKSGFDEDLGKWVLDVVVDGATRDRNGFGRNLKTALKGTM